MDNNDPNDDLSDLCEQNLLQSTIFRVGSVNNLATNSNSNSNSRINLRTHSMPNVTQNYRSGFSFYSDQNSEHNSEQSSKLSSRDCSGTSSPDAVSCVPDMIQDTFDASSKKVEPDMSYSMHVDHEYMRLLQQRQRANSSHNETVDIRLSNNHLSDNHSSDSRLNNSKETKVIEKIPHITQTSKPISSIFSGLTAFQSTPKKTYIEEEFIDMSESMIADSIFQDENEHKTELKYKSIPKLEVRNDTFSLNTLHSDLLANTTSLLSNFGLFSRNSSFTNLANSISTYSSGQNRDHNHTDKECECNEFEDCEKCINIDFDDFDDSNLDQNLNLNKSDQTLEQLKKINEETRRMTKWVDDDAVEKCFNCRTEFTMFVRRHHCRLCGRVFCHYCSNFYTKLPLDILTKIPDRPQSLMSLVWGENTAEAVRVCTTCFPYASKIIRLRKIIKVFEMCQFTIRDLMFMSKIGKTMLGSTDWEDASNFLISKFRDIQYKLSIEELNPSEKQLLWINREFLTGHSRWMVQLAKATDLSDEKAVLILEQLMYKKRRNSCWNIRCSRFCSEQIGINDMLDLIRYNSNHIDNTNTNVISNFILKSLNNIEISVFINYLPFILHNIKNNEFILDILLEKGSNDYNFMANLYWCAKVFCTDVTTSKKCVYSILIRVRETAFKSKFKEMIRMDKLDIKRLHILNEKTLDGKPRIVLPLCHNKTFVGVDDNKIKIINSNSQPTIVYFKDDKGNRVPIMFKNDDVRKDYVVLNIINIIHDILKKADADLDIDIIRYSVMPTTEKTGYIEIIENASTIFNIIEKSGLTIQNYILNHNKNQVISTFRERFVKSTALYCVVSYLLGIGDRHLDNIMISNDGLLFHIDFGFILGQDPKYSNNRLIRVTPEIINVIGGYESEDYDYFKKTCVRIYNILRLHVNTFSNLLSIVPAIDQNITIDILKRELTERFEIGENCLEAATHMDNKVDSKNNFEYMIIDFLYKSKHSLSYVKKSIFN